MSTFTPTSIRFDPPDEPDYLAGAVLKSLSYDMPTCAVWSPAKTLFLGAISFGLLPLLSLTDRLRPFVEGQRRIFIYARRWIAKSLERQDDAIEPGSRRLSLSRIARLLGVTVIVLALVDRLGHGAIARHGVWAVTYGFGRLQRGSSSHPDLVRAHTVWIGLLSAAYVIHYLAVQRAAMRLRRAVRRINAMILPERIAPIAAPKFNYRLYPVWIAAGVLLALSGAIWAIPMMLAAAAQRDYIIDACAGARPGAVRVVRELLAVGPSHGADVPQAMTQKCSNDRCAARIPPDARFCPVCGRQIRDSEIAA